MKRTFVFLAICLFANFLSAQETFPRNAVADQRDGLYAFTNATIYKSWNEKIENATLIIRKGKVEAVGAGIAVPKDAVVIDLMGKTVYPSFTEIYSDYGMPAERPSGNESGGGGGGRRPQQHLTDKEGAYAWNEALKPEFNAAEVFNTNDKAAGELRKLGFGAVLSHKMDGISRGTSVLATLSDDRAHENIVRERVGHHLSFSKGTSSQSYPGSRMGAIALLRQTYLDGQWYKTTGRQTEVNLSLEAWNDALALQQFFEVPSKLDALRAASIGKEFGVTYILKGNGDEYQRLDELKVTGCSFILPVNFPAAFDVEDPYDALSISLSQMKNWELAPSNPARLAKAGMVFALTTNGLEKKDEFMANVRKAIENGLSEEDALKSLTYIPAALTNSLNELGTLEKGKIANFIVTDGNVFKEKTKIYQNWIKGKPFIFKDLQTPELAGKYMLTISDYAYRMEVKDGDDGPSMVLKTTDTSEIKIKTSISNGRINLSFKPEGREELTRLTGVLGKEKWTGNGQVGNGDWVEWTARRTGDLESDSTKTKDEKGRGDKKEGDKKDKEELGAVTYPFTAFGWTERPKTQAVVLKNATVWTNEKEGILQNTDVLIKDGKIAQIGKNINRDDAVQVDATGRHVTPGIIDEHSHIALSSVNEGAQASSAEVRMGDVIDSEDIDIYRQLSGGVTSSQLLHGSANPIGGQSAIIKLRWGFAPEELKNKDAVPFIKFALGENVKRSGSTTNDRFPNTRMGVEQVFVDYFNEARVYGEKKKSGKPYRKDLELEALLEILESKRFITCHSYVQSEINMLMHVAEQFGFRVNTFTHILEGYKVADKMAAHGAGGSSFADWWAYKYEVYEAIPHNGAIMHEQGVTVAFNSDDAEMARRLNQEAAKAVRFGGVKEEEALKFVTLNPAKLLHIDHKTGSLKTGKDADVVLWSDNPLSIYAKADMTFVDGIKFFDRQEDLKSQEAVDKERNRLIQKMLAVKKEGGKTQRANSRRGGHFHCDSEGDEKEED